MIFAWILYLGVVLFVAWAARSIVRQQRKREAQRNSQHLVISPLSGLAIGAMMLELQAIYHPQVRHAMVEMQKEDSVDDESGEEPPGGELFHEQLRRIRNGVVVDELTVLTDVNSQQGSSRSQVRREAPRARSTTANRRPGAGPVS